MKIGIVGASGYSGSELLRFLVNHPGELQVALCTSETYAGQCIDNVLPNLRGFLSSKFEALDLDSLKDRVDAVVLAVPHKVAMSFVPKILAQGLRVVDFSAIIGLRMPKPTKPGIMWNIQVHRSCPSLCTDCQNAIAIASVPPNSSRTQDVIQQVLYLPQCRSLNSGS